MACCPAWAPSPGTLVIVSPHPDDETLAAGGLIHNWIRLGHETIVISVTDGEAGYSNWPRLKDVRRKELRAVLCILGNGLVHIIRLAIPDGQAVRHMARIERAIRAAVDGPSTLICPYENDGHPDHEAAGRACQSVARSLGLPVARYPIWMWHQAAPSTLADLRCGRFWLDRDAEIAKAQALQCFASQTRPTAAAPIIPPHVLEYFSRPYELFLI